MSPLAVLTGNVWIWNLLVLSAPLRCSSPAESDNSGCWPLAVPAGVSVTPYICSSNWPWCLAMMRGAYSFGLSDPGHRYNIRHVIAWCMASGKLSVTSNYGAPRYPYFAAYSRTLASFTKPTSLAVASSVAWLGSRLRVDRAQMVPRDAATQTTPLVECHGLNLGRDNTHASSPSPDPGNSLRKSILFVTWFLFLTWISLSQLMRLWQWPRHFLYIWSIIESERAYVAGDSVALIHWFIRLIHSFIWFISTLLRFVKVPDRYREGEPTHNVVASVVKPNRLSSIYSIASSSRIRKL